MLFNTEKESQEQLEYWVSVDVKLAGLLIPITLSGCGCLSVLWTQQTQSYSYSSINIRYLVKELAGGGSNSAVSLNGIKTGELLPRAR